MGIQSVASGRVERDIREDLAGGHPITPGDIAVGVIIGRTSESFDFFVYAIASVVVFPALIFPHVDPLTGTLASFVLFALGFIMRPVGTMFFTAVDRAWGRGAKLTAALFLLGGSTAAIAFLPGYDTAGTWAILWLALFRMGQGVALGGSWDGLASLLAMNAPEGRRGWFAMMPQLGAPLGLIVASLLFAYSLTVMPYVDFLEWGWRYAFFVALAINVVALFARLRIVETPEYGALFESRDLRPAPVAETLANGWRTIAMGAFAPLASFAMFHMVTVFPLSWVDLYTREAIPDFLVIEACAAALGVVAIIVSGILADRFGRRRVLALSAVGIAAFSGAAPLLLNAGAGGETAYMLVGFVLLGLAFGQSSGALSSGFKPQYRYTGSALTADLAWMFGAGFAPFVALFLSARFGLGAAGLYLLSGAVCTLVALWLNRELGKRIE